VVGLELGNGALRITPRVTVGSVSWDELRSRGGHKSTAGIGLNADYVTGRLGLSADVSHWWVSEGLDINKGVIPKSGFRVGLEPRYIFPVNESVSWYPYLGLAYENWDRHTPPASSRTVWESIDFLTATAGLGLNYDKAYAKAGVNHSFVGWTDRGKDPEGRFGFETEIGLRISPLSFGMFWRGAAFQEPDAKLIHTGAFLGYEF
jgi:hypothetical protein